MRSSSTLTIVWSLVLLLSTTACGIHGPAPGRPGPDSRVIRPGEIADFDLLYGRNCSGCHGVNGQGGLGISLNNPVYLAIADDQTLRRVTADGVPGTSMPAFAQRSGGSLTNSQIDALIRGIRARWAKPDVLRDATAPPYRAETAGDPVRGAMVYSVYCLSCHGTSAKGGRAGSIVDGSYLGLVSDQNLRTTVIVGRPELGAPDWRGNVPGKPMTPQDVSDVVAWLSAKRRAFPGELAAGIAEQRGDTQ